MKNFVVGPNDMKFKINKHKLKLTFSHRKDMVEINVLQFRLNIINFKPCEHLINQLDVDKNELFGNCFIFHYFFYKVLIPQMADGAKSKMKRINPTFA